MEAHAARLHWLARRHRAFFIIICALFLYQIGGPQGRRGHRCLVCLHTGTTSTIPSSESIRMTGAEDQWVGIDYRQPRSEILLIRIMTKAIEQAPNFRR
jgi:hypothetical protein